MDTYTIHMTDTEGETELVASNLRKDEVLFHINEGNASRHSVQTWRCYGEDEELVETLNGQEWLEQNTYLTKPKRRAYGY